MWDVHQQRQLDDLRLRAQQDTLAIEERQLLDRLLSDLDQAELMSVQPVLDVLHAERASLR